MPESPFILEGEEILREGESRVFSIIWEDFTTINASTSSGAGYSSFSVEVYVNGSSDTNNIMSGAASVTANVLTLPTFTVPAGLGGSNIVIEPHMVANSQTYKTGIVIRVLKPGVER